MKSWMAIPVVALACAGAAALIAQPPPAIAAVGLLGAAIAAAVRAYTGASASATVAACAAALLGALGLLELAPPELPRIALAGAAAAFAIAELARPLTPDASPLPALGAALVAGVLAPAYAGLFLIAGIRLVAGPWERPRWMWIAPITGAGLVVFWATRVHVHVDAFVMADGLGPITAVAALAGIAVCARRPPVAAAAMLVAVAGTLVTGAPPVVAAIAAGVAIGRLAALIRLPVGQAFVGAACGFLMLVAPAWTLASR